MSNTFDTEICFCHFFYSPVGFSGAKRDRAEHHYREETCPSASGCHRVNLSSLRKRPHDCRASVVPPPDLRDAAEWIRANSHSGRTLQRGTSQITHPDGVTKELLHRTLR